MKPAQRNRRSRRLVKHAAYQEFTATEVHGAWIILAGVVASGLLALVFLGII